MRGNNSIISKPTPCAEYVLKTYLKKKPIHYYFANKESEKNWDRPVSRRRTPTKARVAPGTEHALSTDPGHLHAHIK